MKAIFNLSRACLPLLDAASTETNPARIINIGSVAGIQQQPVPTFAYDASKAAVHMLTKKLASEFSDRRSDGGHRITVNAIAPGFVPSKMSQQLLTYADKAAIESGKLEKIWNNQRKKKKRVLCFIFEIHYFWIYSCSVR